MQSNMDDHRSRSPMRKRCIRQISDREESDPEEQSSSLSKRAKKAIDAVDAERSDDDASARRILDLKNGSSSSVSCVSNLNAGRMPLATSLPTTLPTTVSMVSLLSFSTDNTMYGCNNNKTTTPQAAGMFHSSTMTRRQSQSDSDADSTDSLAVSPQSARKTVHVSARLDCLKPPIVIQSPFLEETKVNRVGAFETKENVVLERVHSKKPRSFMWQALILSLVAVVACVSHGFPSLLMRSTPSGIAHADSLYVPGGGFSGFWFTLGRLRSIPDAQDKDYYCYSSGCLAVVSTLCNYTMEEVFGIAVDIQKQWQRGEISRYEVVGVFVDDLLGGGAASTEPHHQLSEAVTTPRPRLDSTLLSRLNIITSVKGRWFGLKSVTRTPVDVESLRTMLLQTTWIPFAIGTDLWHQHHMDGAFTLRDHPTCAHRVGVEFNLDLIVETFNVNLGHATVEKFWNMGMAYGL